MKKRLVEQKQYHESVKNDLPWWPLDRRSVEICRENRKNVQTVNELRKQHEDRKEIEVI